MWKAKELRLVNFISHSESKWIIVNGVATMVYGINLYDDGQESNGSGKSALLEGFCVALLGESLRKFSLEVWPSETNFILFKAKNQDARQIWEELISRSILIRDFSMA